MGGGWGVNVLFSLNHCFLILKHVLGGPRWKSKEIQASRLFSCQFQVSFMPILCQFYAKKNCIFLHGFDPAPSPFDIVKKCNIGTVGHPLQMIMQQKWDQLRTYAPVKNLFDNMDVLISFTNDRARWKTQSCKPVRLTQVWGSVKHVYKVHVLARVLYTRASTCVYARARTQ